MDASDPYYQRMIADMQSMNCNADFDNDGDIDELDLPTPDFIERAGDSTNPHEVGDEVSVTLHCDFGLLTPLVGAIVGDPLDISATTTFLVFGGEINGIPVPPDPVPAGCIGTDKEVPDLVGLTIGDARTAWTAAGFTGTFNPSSAPDVKSCSPRRRHRARPSVNASSSRAVSPSHTRCRTGAPATKRWCHSSSPRRP